MYSRWYSSVSLDNAVMCGRSLTRCFSRMFAAAKQRQIRRLEAMVGHHCAALCFRNSCREITLSSQTDADVHVRL